MLVLFNLTIFISLAAYVFVELYFLYHALRSTTLTISNTSIPKIKLTIIIPVRNEAENILDCLRSLIKVDYPLEFMEIIISDDDSYDSTPALVTDFIKSNPEHRIKLLEYSVNDLRGKKSAISRAVDQSAGEVIITTDADCKFDSDWLKTMAVNFNKPSINMVCGPVVLQPANTWVRALSSIEQAVLTLLSSGSMECGYPLMCNGANLAYRKSSFYDCGGFDYGSDHPGGDDTFLMLSMNQKFPGSIVYLSDEKALVKSLPPSSFNELFGQRVRHGSKVSAYKEKYIRNVGAILSGFNILIVLVSILSFWWVDVRSPLLICFIIKLLLDLTFGAFAIFSFGSNKLFPWLLPVILIYPLYITFVSIAVMFRYSYKWKERHY